MSREICPDCGGTTMDGDSNCTCDTDRSINMDNAGKRIQCDRCYDGKIIEDQSKVIAKLDELYRREVACRLSQEGQRQGDHNCATTIQEAREIQEELDSLAVDYSKQEQITGNLMATMCGDGGQQLVRNGVEKTAKRCLWKYYAMWRRIYKLEFRLALAEKVVEAVREAESWLYMSDIPYPVCCKFEKALEEYDKGKEPKDECR